MIGLIAGREIRASLRSPVAWMLFAATQFICAWQFLSYLEWFQRNQGRLQAVEGAPGLTDLVVAPTFATGAFVLLILAPALTMRTFSAERSDGTLILLLAAPVRGAEIVLGKYLACLALLLIPALGLAVMPLSLLAGGSFDAGQFACAFAGVLLVAAFAAAAGLYVSAATAHPAVAVIGTMMLLLLLWFSGGLAGAESGDSLRALSIAVHLQNLMNGIIDTADVAYFAIGTAGFLALAIARLANERAPV